MRDYSLPDEVIGRLDKILKAFPKKSLSKKRKALSLPLHPSTALSKTEQKHSAALMRINHSGEVCAQALYLGQALVARDQTLADHLYQAAEEEQEHLHWCANRIRELGGHRSILNPIWGVGSFGIGIMAGLLGDKISLGFLAETEEQVTRHLEKHLDEISFNDIKSQEILNKMCEDEKRHATHAVALGGVLLPKTIRRLMFLCSKIMTYTTRYL